MCIKTHKDKKAGKKHQHESKITSGDPVTSLYKSPGNMVDPSLKPYEKREENNSNYGHGYKSKPEWFYFPPVAYKLVGYKSSKQIGC
jgi:hypothetical protein